ncbi:MAG: NAD(P)-dependent oxidoreductase [Oxalobacter sp.]|nr:MAG: NAD(P)-dependent oxidoreductase [Oxalobacter sp.]
MAKNLLKAGYPLTAWNRTREKAEPLAADGAHIASTLAEAVKDADIIITILADGSTVIDVINAALPAFKRGAIVVDMSSTKQSEAKDIHAMLAKVGVGFIDAPVSGGTVGAAAATLAIMAGGSAANFEQVKPVLSVLGRPTLVGAVSAGQVAKLCNQLIVGGTLSIIAEAMLLAQAAGADPAAMRTAIRGGFAESRLLEVHGQRMLDRAFIPGGQIKTQAKDMDNIMIAAQEAGITLPVSALVTEIYHSILDAYPNADQSAALLAIEKLNPGKRVGDAEDKF